jgi:hypothetical protein
MTLDPGASPGPEAASEDATEAGPAIMARPPGMLAGTADRDRTFDVLKAGLVEGRLTQSDHDERMTQVSEARTYGDLALLVADLPVGPGSTVGYTPPPQQPMFNSLAVASLICGLAEAPTLGLTAVPAVLLGIRARQQILETGERGDALALTGLILGWTAIAVFLTTVLAIMIWLLLPPTQSAGGPIGS